MLIGLAGKAGSGKSTVGDFLVADHGFTQYSLAEPMREALLAMNPLVRRESSVRLTSAVNIHGWDVAKRKYPEIRQLLQRLGTEVGREQWHENFWITRQLQQMLKDGVDPVDQDVVITDVRFENEADYVWGQGGHVVRIIGGPHARFITGSPLENHASETGTFPADYTIHNHGTLDDLLVEVGALVRDIRAESS
jgi:hypothetical protein